MKQIKRKNKKLPILLSFFGIFFVVLTAVIILNLIPKNTDGGNKEPPEILEGESLYSGMTVAYPVFESASIDFVSVKNDKGSYSVAKNGDGEFIFYYADENGKLQAYAPKITAEDAAFEYDSLYAMETGDGYGRFTKLSYLFSAVSTLYFNERIALSSDAAEREAQLLEYGFAEDEVQSVSFIYIDKDKKQQSHVVRIGARLLTGDGRYFMVDNRPYIYSTVGTTINYALAAFSDFINPRLVSAGLSEDNGFAPYLVSDFKEWRNTLYNTPGDVIGAENKKNTAVIINAKTIVPISKDDDSNILNETEYPGGYHKSEYEKIEIPLFEIAGDPAYAQMEAALIGSAVGKLSEPMTVTVASNSRWVDLDGNESVRYGYTIIAVESVIGAGGENATPGTPVGDSTAVKVTYNYKIDGKNKNLIAAHAVINLDSPLLPDAAEAAIRALSVGELSAGEQVSFDVEYTAQTSLSRRVAVLVTDIVEIYNKDYLKIDTVAADSIVSCRYVYVIDGVRGSAEYSTVVNLATDESDMGAGIKEKLIGKSVGRGQDIKVFEYTAYSEIFSDFIAYEIDEIPYFYTREKIASFRFVNSSIRDPFYGESIYENTLDNKYKIYGLNAAACQEVSKVLGGIGETTGVADGLVGLEVVAMGLTPETMITDKYNLYAYTVYYELPRGIIVTGTSDDEDLDDYTWYSTLGFTLYISEEDPIEGVRYVGSDMYDIVVKVKSEDLVFLDYDFTEFWARNSLMQFDVSRIEAIELDFNMSDLYGSYDMDVGHTTLYIADNGKAYLSPNSIPEGATLQGTYDKIVVDVKPEGECTENELTKYIAEHGYDAVSLTELYNQVLGGGTEIKVGNDAAGSAHFKTLMQVSYMLRYEGTLTPEEQAAALEREPIMTLGMTMLDGRGVPSKYVYEFYRAGERQVMVRLYKAASDGNAIETPVSDFYISTYSFKKIVSGYLALFNAEPIDEDYGYID